MNHEILGTHEIRSGGRRGNHRAEWVKVLDWVLSGAYIGAFIVVLLLGLGAVGRVVVALAAIGWRTVDHLLGRWL